jgi:hypothetical protein
MSNSATKLDYLGKLVKKDGKLVSSGVSDRELYKLFEDNVKEGSIVEVYYSIVSEKGSLSQLAKVHANIREIANYTGNNFSEIKNIVKEKSGLFEGQNIKSFAHCTREELNAAIETTIIIGQDVGLAL